MAANTVPVFNGVNYDSWRIKMLAYLKSQGMWNLVENGYDDSKTEEAEEMQKDGETLLKILEAIPESIVPCLKNAETSKEAWTILQQKYGRDEKEIQAEECRSQLSGNQNIGKIRGSMEAEKDVESLPSSPIRGGSEFHVFLSFRGEDTRKHFTRHLYDDLEKHGISTFMDSEKLQKGEQIDKLLDYIKRSKICVPIFSIRYAESKWCLKEITQSLECGMKIIPVFYDVEPSEVREQSGNFQYAFELHESNMKLKQEEVAKWREALKKVGGLSGFNLKDMNGDEAKLRRKIVKVISTIVHKVPYDVAKYSIGLETRIQDVKNILNHGHNRDHLVRVVGIHGMGGIGKTTIAKAVYNDMAPQGFDGATCFVSDIREQSRQPDGLVKLQKLFFEEVFKEKDNSINYVAHGQSLIKDRASRKKILLILDDVDSVEQIDALVGGRDWFGSGSVILITTRDKQVLLAHDVKEEEIYKPQGLNEAQSLKLFICHAFHGKQPQGEYVRLAKQVVEATSGLPLTVKVLGSLFSSIKNVGEWKDTLEKLKKIPPKEVQKVLKISYDSLEDYEKQIFLDISCFLIGRFRQNATYMWEGCGWHPTMAIGKLERRSLIKIDENSGEFEMHDQIRDMGREIVAEKSSRQLEKQSRLWNTTDVLDLLRRRVGTKDVEAISLRYGLYSTESEFVANIKSFAGMSQLRVLLTYHMALKGDDYKHFPKELKWLFCNLYGLDSLPTSLHLENIVVLDLSYSNIVQFWGAQKVNLNLCLSLWSGKSKSWEMPVLGKLRVLKLNSCDRLRMCPDFRSMPNLQILDCEGCVEMSELHPSIGHLQSLINLNLRCCKSLKELPKEVWQLISLEELNLDECSEITTLSSPIGDCMSSKQSMFEKLKFLNLDCCSSLNTCPHHCHHRSEMPILEKLRVLKLKGCKSLTVGPDLRSMPHLQILDCDGCEMMIELHPFIVHLQSLTNLILQNCRSLKELPKAWQLTSIEELMLYGCCRITALPSPIGELEKIKFLNFDECWSLITCPNFKSMPHLEKLRFNGVKLKEFDPSISHLKSLIELDLERCDALKELPQEIGQLTSLEQLNMCGCSKISTLPESIGHLKQLKSLHLRFCSSLQSLPPLPSSLTSLYVYNCGQLESITDVSNAKRLPKLDLSGCERLVDIPGIEQLKYLKTLRLFNCRSLCNSFLGRIKGLDGLESLHLTGCSQITALPNSIISLENLLHLSVNNCSGLKFLPQLPPSLTSLNAQFCTELERIEGVPFSKGLKKLKLTGCRKLVDIPDIVQFKELKCLKLGGCRSLQDSFLERLELSISHQVQHCPKGYSIPGRVIKHGLSNSQSLSFLIPEWLMVDSNVLVLGVDEKSLNRIRWEVDGRKRHNIPSDEEVRSPIDSKQGRSVVHLVFSTDDAAEFPFPAFFEDKDLIWKLPTATVTVRRRELSSPLRMLKMHVSIDGCVLLHADFFSASYYHKFMTRHYLHDDNIVKVRIIYD